MGSCARRFLGCLCVLLLFAGCFEPRLRDAAPSTKLARLNGRCIELKRPLFIVPGGDENFVDSYLAETNNAAGTGIQLKVGDQFVIQRVILKRAMDGRYAIVVGSEKDNDLHRHIGIFLLFRPEWVKSQTDAAFAGRSDASSIGAEALASEWARWCTH